MRKFVLTLAALAAFGVAMPVLNSTPADAKVVKKVVIIKEKKRHYDRGLHLGWRNRHHHHNHTTGATVIVR